MFDVFSNPFSVLFNVCAPVTDVTKYSLSKKSHKRVTKKILTVYLIYRHNTYQWVPVVSLLNYLTLAIEL